MIQKIKNLIKEKDIKVLIGNFFSLAILQVLNIVLPFLTIPYLLRVIGVEKFGLISFALAFVTFFQLAVEYGFNTITTRDISIVSNNKTAVERIYSEVFYTKIFLFFIVSLVFINVVFGIEKFRVDWNIYVYTYGMVLGQLLFPIWLFQGIQKMKYMTYLNVVFKTIFTLCIFIFIKDTKDYYLAPLFTSLGFICSGIGSLIIVHKVFKYRLVAVSFKAIIKQLKISIYLFLSELQIALIANANILIIGFLLSNAAVGYYATADKVIRAISNLQSPVVNAIYPHISKLWIENRFKAIQQVRKLLKVSLVVLLGGCIILFLLANYIFIFLFGERTEESVLVFRILILFPVMSFFDQLFGKLVLLPNKEEKAFFKVFFYTSLVSVVICTLFTYFWGYYGTAIGNMVVQVLVAYGMYYYAKSFLKLK